MMMIGRLFVYERGLGESGVKRELALGLLISMILICMLFSGLNILSIRAAPMVIIVPDQYPTIQAAINNASDGDTIFVRAGTYCEHVVVNKTVALLGENKDATIIDGSSVGIVVNVTRDGVGISGFTIRNSGPTWNIGGPPYGAGIYMGNVTGCSICDNRIVQDAAAIQLEFGADGNVIANNTISNVGLGFGTLDASWNIFSGNNVTSNGRGLGINVNSDYNVISDNIITAPEWVIAVHACHYNNITRNYIANGQIGIYLPDSSDNMLYYNTIVNNLLQASTTYGGFTSLHNFWDSGYPSGGNYWSDYDGVDFFSGIYQNETGSDMRGDSPYAIDSINVDSYPLVKPMLRLIQGDVNYDGKVDLEDLVILTLAYGSSPGDTRWNPNADINDNGKVGLSDLVILAVHYDQHIQ